MAVSRSDTTVCKRTYSLRNFFHGYFSGRRLAMEDVAEINVSLDFPFEISFDESAPAAGSTLATEDSDVSEITADSGTRISDLCESSSVTNSNTI